MIRIQVSKETKELTRNFRTKRESYDVIVRKLYDIAVQEQLRVFALSSKHFISIDEAIRRIKQKYRKN